MDMDLVMRALRSYESSLNEMIEDPALDMDDPSWMWSCEELSRVQKALGD